VRSPSRSDCQRRDVPTAAAPRDGAGFHPQHAAVPLPIWRELFGGREMAVLRQSPVYWGFGVPHGCGAPVVVVPGLLATDVHLTEFLLWLRRIGYRPYASGLGINADCPNLLLPVLATTIERAHCETGRHVHLIGHSFGGLLARAVATGLRHRVGSVITLAAPFRGVSVHPAVLCVAGTVRNLILLRRGSLVRPGCYTGECTCDFVRRLHAGIPRSLYAASIYSKTDGVVDWRSCRSDECNQNFEVPATHTGLLFNPIVYQTVAHCLARASARPPRRARGF
jgi:triacylglycerol lipase